MDLLVDVLTWLGYVAGGFAAGAALVIAAMAWLLNRPIEDDEPRHGARSP